MTAQPAATDRRAELLAIAAGLFAERGLRATTVRDIADAAGILSGSLYHHFDSKESMVDEILRGFLDALFDRYREIVAQDLGPRATLEAVVDRVLRGHRRAQRRRRRSTRPRPAGWPISPASPTSTSGSPNSAASGTTSSTPASRPAASATTSTSSCRYRFLRDTVWVGVSWYRPGGKLSIDDIARQYLAIVLDGIASPRRADRPRK